MKLLTYFNAFVKASYGRDVVESGAEEFGERPGGKSGIAVDSDPMALKWQKYDRQAKKFERMIRLSLGDTTHWLSRKSNDEIDHLLDADKLRNLDRRLKTLSRLIIVLNKVAA